MCSKMGGLFLGIILFATGLLQAQETEFQIYENGAEIQIPDSVKTQLTEQSESVQNILLQWFTADGYLNASVDSITNNKAYITRNCAFVIDTLQITYSGERDTTISISSGEQYSQQRFTGMIESQLAGLSQEGYPFARAEIIRFSPQYEECSVDIEVAIETGGEAIASEIYFSGAESNDRGYLRKVSRFQSGQLVTPAYLRFVRSNLNASELFNSVGTGQIVIRNGEPVIVFEVQERSLNQFDGLLGYVPDAAGNGQIVGDIELSLWNVLTQGNGFNFRYERLRPETSELDLGASQDWIGDIPVGITMDFRFYQNDTTYQTRDLELGAYYRISSSFRLTGGIGFQGSTSGGNLPMVVEPDGRKRTARLGFEYSTLENYDVPTSGRRISVDYGIANKALEDDSTGSFIQNSLHMRAEQYIPILEQSVLALSVNGFLLEAERVTLNDLIRFGGANSFRGYAEDQFRAGQLIWGDLEYRFLLDSRSYLFVFGAAGRYHRPKLLTETNTQFQSTSTLSSTGFGLSYQTRIGRLKFTYAVSPEESIANGKVHFGIRTEL